MMYKIKNVLDITSFFNYSRAHQLNQNHFESEGVTMMKLQAAKQLNLVTTLAVQNLALLLLKKDPVT